MFDQAQIQEFKEVRLTRAVRESLGALLARASTTTYWFVVLVGSQAFNMIDQNRDGFIDNEDLKDMLASLGQTLVSSPKYYITVAPPYSVHCSIHRPGTQ